MFERAEGVVDGRALLQLTQRMFLATFDASSAEGAVAGIVTPDEFSPRGGKCDGATGAPEATHRATRAEFGVELNKTAKPWCDGWTLRERQSAKTAPQVVEEHPKDVHQWTLWNSEELVAAIRIRQANTMVHCQ